MPILMQSGRTGLSGISGYSGASGINGCPETYTIKFVGMSGIGTVVFTKTSSTTWLGSPSGNITLVDGVWILTIISNNALTDTYSCENTLCPPSTIDEWVVLSNTSGGYISNIYNSNTGASGFSGYSGTNGTNGISGYSGTNGTSGFSGYSGVDGCAPNYVFTFSGVVGVTSLAYVRTYYAAEGYWYWRHSSGNTVVRDGSNWVLTVYSALFDRDEYTCSLPCPSTTVSDWTQTVSGTGGSLTAISNSYSVSGYSGRSGYSGFSGYSGTGASGFSGYSGTGVSGLSGYSGRSGYSGISGYSGTGPSGFSGYSGRSGYSGFSGYSGVSGFSGYSGRSGYSGFSGYSGASGYSGSSGFSGYSGYSGFLASESDQYILATQIYA